MKPIANQAIMQSQLGSGRVGTSTADTPRNPAPPEAEIPALLKLLRSRIEALSERQAAFHCRLSPVLHDAPRDNHSVSPAAATAIGGEIAEQVGRIDCLIEDLSVIDGLLAL